MRACGNVCCVVAVIKDSGFLSRGVLKFIICLCRRCFEKCECHADVVLLCLVCILWQFSMLRSE